MNTLRSLPALPFSCEDSLKGLKQVTNDMLRFKVKEGNGNVEIGNKSTFGERLFSPGKEQMIIV